MDGLFEEINRVKKLMGLAEGLNLPKANQNRNWIGVDRDLLISLEDYQFIGRQPDKRDYSDEWLVIYKVQDDNFDSGWIRESELDELMTGAGWMNKQDIQSVLDYSGYKTIDNWMEDNFISKFHYLINYFGFENLMGGAYHTFPLKDAIKKINEYSGGSKYESEDYT